jgi:hypothetical protein
MKVSTIFKSFYTLIILFVMSSAVVASMHTSGNVNIATTKISLFDSDLSSGNVANTNKNSELNYLRFDVNNFTGVTENTELPVMSIDNLRFDANNYIFADESFISDLPVTNEYEFLRFDAYDYIKTNTEVDELPDNDYQNLRFDVNSFSGSGTTDLDELPENWMN